MDPAWVCRDHLTAISRLLTAYRRDHRGKMPDQLSALQKWTVDQSRADPGTIARLFRAPRRSGQHAAHQLFLQTQRRYR